MATTDGFEYLEEYFLKNVQTNCRRVRNGAYGYVEEVVMDGVVCAAKKLHPVLVYSSDELGGKRIRERFVQECIIMSQLRHPHIVQFLGIYFPSAEEQRLEQSQASPYSRPHSPINPNPTGLPWLIMEYLPYTLDHILEKRPNIPIHVKVSFLLGIARGLLYLHNKGIYHRNLTVRNVLVTSSMEAKITDFGESRMFKSSTSSHNVYLTPLPGNQPPEADQERSGGTVMYDNAIDIFSFGEIVLFAITQKFPCNLLSSTYPDPGRPGMVLGRTEVERRSKYFEIAEDSSKNEEDQRLIKLSKHCLQNDFSSRPKAEVILEELTYLEKSLIDRRLNGSESAEVWKKDKLQLVELLEEKQKELDKQQKMNSRPVQSPTESSKEVQELLIQLIHLENENRLLKEKSALEIEELQTVNAQLRAHMLEMEENLNIMTQNYDQLMLNHSMLQRQLDRSRDDNSILVETNRDLQQAIALMEEEKTRCLEEVAQLQQDKHILQEEKAGRIREKEPSARVERRPEDAARLQDIQRQAQLNRRRAEEAEAEARELKTQWIIQKSEIELTNEELGRGGWGAVMVAYFRGTKVAAKCFYKELHSDFYQRMFTREMTMAARLRHPNLVQFIGASVDVNIIILTELMTASLRIELEKGPMSQQQVNAISLDVARALNYLHLMQPHPIIHRDISSANVLLDPLPDNCWKVKVSDYGSVNLLTHLQTVGPGNPVYAAPEANIPALQTPKMDIFSFGVLLVEMLTHQFPDVSSRQRLIASIDHPEYLDLIEQCLNEEKDNRPSAQQLLSKLDDIIQY